MESNFEWDEDKAKANLVKHEVSFDEAITIFNDPYSITIYDPDHSEQENRFVDLGTSNKGRILVVVYTERENKLRIISCRKATPTERRKYEESSD
ncbi:MAG: BrnT family toxin [Chloroflexota bacterium]|nr:MAG: BrnT family toxin [Chloroflexota bacterium]